MTSGQRRGPGRGPARREKADDFGLAWKRLFQSWTATGPRSSQPW